MRSVSTPPYRLRKLTAPSSTTISGTLSGGMIIAIGGSGERPRAMGPPPDRPLGEAWTACRPGADLRASAAAAATIRASTRVRMLRKILIVVGSWQALYGTLHVPSTVPIHRPIGDRGRERSALIICVW